MRINEWYNNYKLLLMIIRKNILFITQTLLVLNIFLIIYYIAQRSERQKDITGLSWSCRHLPYNTTTSLCNSFATFRGPKQKVFSLSVFGPREESSFTHERNLDYLKLFFTEVNELFPNWLVRIYYDDQSTLTLNDINLFECLYPYVDFCNINQILPNSRYVSGRIWRFLPIEDLLVDIVNIRDLDSPITKREQLAVNYWLNNTTKSFHIMRDHKHHLSAIQAGMWGVRRTSTQPILLDKIKNSTLIKNYKSLMADEDFLADHLWKRIRDKNDIVVHDSFYCFKHGEKECLTFPSERPSDKENCFVGCWRPCCLE
ncbi:unnamed protein product [Didymodactylos carnosus]|uniref:Uncharacterized protein n=1 Tax=Didymodactylos carnosus TaxID=1234261 RepID=A0A815GJU1_9BILA|nr:unnamed protein product [Didymodactylos carnosus]CAF1339205.1 unnamed protein product [Didymodactylos carnosus]CAF4146838.1 unnamed protein product [Didymodactylos carnosus]CAF4198651.1 unnamed protein product [Didymodactylos carnosus]